MKNLNNAEQEAKEKTLKTFKVGDNAVYDQSLYSSCNFWGQIVSFGKKVKIKDRRDKCKLICYETFWILNNKTEEQINDENQRALNYF